MCMSFIGEMARFSVGRLGQPAVQRMQAHCLPPQLEARLCIEIKKNCVNIGCLIVGHCLLCVPGGSRLTTTP